jgi:hypothetical protein
LKNVPIELYGGPCDGAFYEIPENILEVTVQIEIQDYCTQMALDKLGLPRQLTLCSHLYIRYNKSTLRFRFHSTSLAHV